MSFIEHSSDDRGGLIGDVLIDQEERCVNPLTSLARPEGLASWSGSARPSSRQIYRCRRISRHVPDGSRAGHPVEDEPRGG